MFWKSLFRLFLVLIKFQLWQYCVRQENTVNTSILRYCQYEWYQRTTFKSIFLAYFSGPPASRQCPIRASKEHLFAVSFGEFEKSVINHIIWYSFDLRKLCIFIYICTSVKFSFFILVFQESYFQRKGS